MKNHTCCFTGHRNLNGADPALLGQRIERAILKCLELGIYRFENGMAIGFDLLSARHVLRLRQFHPEIQLHLILPCRDQSIRWNTQQIATYRRILGLADSVVCLSDRYYDGCMRVRNYRMVEDSCACICYYDGAVRSGTYQTVNYAKKNGLLILNCYESPAGNPNRSYFDV